ncbi:hypothetical protein [Telluribacter sp.]|jgi:hypothetical protein|uniref:hypothetical protein n=1 Tax=Telluribacter sp. TaxID=1978767 RepID=UPI002E125F40|nr:hypothetical protein [Telluribacter sp.]
MSLQVGGFFEGAYQLTKEVDADSSLNVQQWLADDYSSGQKTPVIIQIFAYEYDANLYWHHSAVRGLRKVGQSLSGNCRYFVWEHGTPVNCAPVINSELLPQEKIQLSLLIDTLPVTPHETIVSVSTPEFFRLGDGLLIFYRKQASKHADPKEHDLIRRFWKGVLAIAPAADTALAPAPELPKEVLKTAPSRTFLRFRLTPTALLLTVIGLILALAALRVKGIAPATRHPNLAAFDRSIEMGMAEERKGEYDKAMEHFKTAAAVPFSDETEARLDSLATAYEARATAECQKYHTAQSPNLYFIPNQYYQYAAALSESAPKKCE